MKPLLRALVACVLLSGALHADTYRVKYAITVGSADHPVQLKAGDTVQVLGINGGKAVISITLPGGDSTICQTSADALEPASAPPAPASANASYTPPPPPAPTPTAVASAPPGSPFDGQKPWKKDSAGGKDLDNAVVVIKGDMAEGTGFLVHTDAGPAVVTNQHVLAGNPHARIWSTSGEEIRIVSLKAAVDRDLALLAVQDDHDKLLRVAAHVGQIAHNGDEVITPGNSQGGEVVLDTRGQILGIGPQRVEISNPIYHGNSGGPVFHTASGTVIAVVTQAMRVTTNNEIDKASHQNKNSAITGDMRYFGLRLDNVPQWEPVDPDRYLVETTFLKNFHQTSMYLDSFLNGNAYEKAHVASADGQGHPDSHYYLRDPKVSSAADTFHHEFNGAERSEQLDAIRELILSLQGVASTDMDQIQNPNNFYQFNRVIAREEVQYRQALAKEIDTVGDKVGDLGH